MKSQHIHYFVLVATFIQLRCGFIFALEGVNKEQPQVQKTLDNLPLVWNQKENLSEIENPTHELANRESEFPKVLTQKVMDLLSEALDMLIHAKETKCKKWIEAFVFKIGQLAVQLETSDKENKQLTIDDHDSSINDNKDEVAQSKQSTDFYSLIESLHDTSQSNENNNYETIETESEATVPEEDDLVQQLYQLDRQNHLNNEKSTFTRHQMEGISKYKKSKEPQLNPIPMENAEETRESYFQENMPDSSYNEFKDTYTSTTISPDVLQNDDPVSLIVNRKFSHQQSHKPESTFIQRPWSLSYIKKPLTLNVPQSITDESTMLTQPGDTSSENNLRHNSISHHDSNLSTNTILNKMINQENIQNKNLLTPKHLHTNDITERYRSNLVHEFDKDVDQLKNDHGFDQKISQQGHIHMQKFPYVHHKSRMRKLTQQNIEHKQIAAAKDTDDNTHINNYYTSTLAPLSDNNIKNDNFDILHEFYITKELNEDLEKQLRAGKVIILSDSVVRSNFDKHPKTHDTKSEKVKEKRN